MSETTALAVTNNSRPGVDFSKAIFRLTPKTLSINQPTTKDESAIKGKLRVVETGKQMDKVRVVLLVEPVEQRQYRVGERGNNFAPENLLCFCSRVEKTNTRPPKELTGPSPKAKMPQAMKCEGCPHSSWDRYRAKKDKGLTPTESDFPECESFYKLLLLNVDDHNKPLYMWVRGRSRDAFDKGLERLTEELFDIAASGVPPEVYYVSFVITPKKDPKNTKTTTYVMEMSDFQVCTPEQIAAFNKAYDSFAAAPPLPTEEEQAAEKVAAAEQAIEDAMAGKTAPVDTVASTVVASGSETTVVEGEYVTDEIPV